MANEDILQVLMKIYCLKEVSISAVIMPFRSESVQQAYILLRFKAISDFYKPTAYTHSLFIYGYFSQKSKKN